jgi:hypothetical protein
LSASTSADATAARLMEHYITNRMDGSKRPTPNRRLRAHVKKRADIHAAFLSLARMQNAYSWNV